MVPFLQSLALKAIAGDAVVVVTKSEPTATRVVAIKNLIFILPPLKVVYKLKSIITWT